MPNFYQLGSQCNFLEWRISTHLGRRAISLSDKLLPRSLVECSLAQKVANKKCSLVECRVLLAWLEEQLLSVTNVYPPGLKSDVLGAKFLLPCVEGAKLLPTWVEEHFLWVPKFHQPGSKSNVFECQTSINLGRRATYFERQLFFFFQVGLNGNFAGCQMSTNLVRITFFLSAKLLSTWVEEQLLLSANCVFQFGMNSNFAGCQMSTNLVRRAFFFSAKLLSTWVEEQLLLSANCFFSKLG